MARTATVLRNADVPLQKDHFVYKKGDNPSHTIMREGKTYTIEEWNRHVQERHYR